MGVKIIAKNKRASFDYQLLKKFEAGLVLEGTEVKSLRQGRASIVESYAQVDGNGEAWILNMNIPQYKFGNVHNHQENRKRKLILHKHELKEIYHRIKSEALSLVSTSLYFKKSWVKLEVALAKPKKKHDKRESEKKRDIERKIRRAQYD